VAGSGERAAAGLVWVAARRGSFDCALAATLISGILVAPHAYLQDCSLALPALLITFRLSAARSLRYFHVFLFSPFCAVWAMLDAGWIVASALLAYLGVVAGLARRKDL